MALPKEPRQKMINIMYLVLTAILALNVSSEILNAFKTIEESFKKSNSGLAVRSEGLIKAFQNEELKKKFPEKIAEWEPRALKVKDASDALYNYIETLKSELKKDSKLQPDGKFNEDDLEASTRLFVTEESKKGKGEELYAKLDQYKKDLAIIYPSIAFLVSGLPIDLNVPTLQNKDNESVIARMPEAQKWSYVYFHMTPTIAGLAILSKFQNDIRNSEAQLIEHCFSQVSTTQISINEFGIIAGANATMVMSGDEIEIFAGVGGYNKDAKPTITIDGSNVPLGADGKAVYKTTATSAGEFTKHITATFTNPNSGKLESKTAEVKYKVGTPTGLAVSTDKTRVFYIGAPGGNPVSVSGATGGAGSIKISVVSGPASVSPSSIPGVFNVITTAEGKVVLSVSDGKNTKQIDAPSKKMPPPDFAFVTGGVLTAETGRSGVVPVAAFKIAGFIAPHTPEWFTFDGVKYSIKSFKIQFSGKGFSTPVTQSVSGGALASVKNYINLCDAGTNVLISDIVALDNGGQTQPIPSPIFLSLK